MTVRKLIGSAAAALVLGLVVPTSAQAVNFQFQCPGCEASNPGQRYNDYFYALTLASASDVTIEYVGTATGNQVLWVFNSDPGNVTPNNVGFAAYLTGNVNNPDAQQNTALGTFPFAAGTYYFGLTGECSQGQGNAQGCNIVIKVDGEDIPPSEVPAPGALLLLGTGLVGLIGVGRRR